MMKRVSVCIPSYNGSKYIRQTIHSVLDSTYPHLEVIVNDDASTDGTDAMVRAISDDRVSFYQNEFTVGVPENWNRALEKSVGEYVGLLNHDDLYGSFWLAFAVHILEKYPHIGWVATAFRVVDDGGRVLGAVSRFPETGEIATERAFLCISRLDGLGPYIARREILEEIGRYDPDAGPSADNDLFLRLVSRYPLYYSANPQHAAWRLHTGNLTHRWGVVEQTKDSLSILEKAFGDETLPRELRRYRRRSYSYFYQKVMCRAQECLEKNDLETALELVRLVAESSYVFI
jgi:glycosyltransferase involved in cell wall biosynthesis